VIEMIFVTAMEPDLQRLRVLLVEDDEDDYVLIRELFSEIEGSEYQVDWATSYEQAGRMLRAEPPDIVVCDYRLGSHTGLDLLRDLGPQLTPPVILLTGQGDRSVDLEAMRMGAADYLVKAGLSAPLLERSVRYAVRTHRLVAQIRRMSVTDELTGLYNRRGFFTVAAHQLLVASRSDRDLVVVFADLDQMKQINDQFGHQEGDRALQQVAGVLRQTFRQSDLIARISGDEFAVLATQTQREYLPVMLDRLQQNLAAHNDRSGNAYSIELSVGAVVYDESVPTTIDELLAQADAAMYQNKLARRVTRLC
jgi:diguanylate cyclase (GGDEF)-like protein